MKMSKVALTTVAAAAMLGAIASPGACNAASSDSEYFQTYSNLQGEVVLDNARVVVQRFVLQPGQASGTHTYHSDPLLVFIKGGLLTSKATGRTTLWKDGRVAWQSTTDHPEGGSTNTGSSPVEWVSVTLKPVAHPAMAGASPKYQYLNYPNIPGEDLLEDDRVIVQRFLVKPGQWEGVHAHHPDMLYIHIKGGQWASRSKSQAEKPYPQPSPDGEVGWMQTIPLSEGHESGNIGTSSIDLVWVTLKQ
jgi:hypothetical protein